MDLPPATRARLAKVAALLASPHDGERAAAGLLATRLLQQHHMTWADLLAPSTPAGTGGPLRRPWNPTLSGSAMAAQCLAWSDCLTPWEREFCRGLVGKFRLSPRQQMCLHSIAAKVMVCATAGGAQ